MISFSRPFYYWYPYPFPGYYYLRRFYVVAPYWADHDIRREGSVSYETFERGRSENDDRILDRVNTFLQLNGRLNFYGTFMIMAEWRDVHPYPHGSGNSNYFDMYYPSISDFTRQVDLCVCICTCMCVCVCVCVCVCSIQKLATLYKVVTRLSPGSLWHSDQP